MAPSPRALATVVAVALLAIGCTDDGETTTATGLDLASTTTEQPTDDEPPTTEEASPSSTEEPSPSSTEPAVPSDEVAAEACGGIVGTLLVPVGAETPEDDVPLRDALALLAEEGPSEVAADAEAILALDCLDSAGGEDLLEMFPEEMAALQRGGLEAMVRLYDWALGACPVEGVAWSCPVTEAIVPLAEVGEETGGDGETAPTTEAGTATPEELYGEAEGEGDPVEVIRTDDEVVVAWVDEAGRAVEVLTLVADGGWRVDELEVCEDPMAAAEDDGEDEDMDAVGEEIGG